MFDTDKIYNYLEKIKNRCCATLSCDECILSGAYSNCRVVEVVNKLNRELAVEPTYWNTKQIISILEEE